MGPSAGHGALTAPLMDFVVMVEGAALFSAGPPLVEAATGEDVSKEELGGTAVHTAVSGVAHNAVPDDATRSTSSAAISVLPVERVATRSGAAARTTLRRAARRAPRPDPGRPAPRLRRPARRRAGCRPRCVLEIEPAFGRPIVTALVRLGGESVAVVANQPAVKAGAIDSDAADKAAHFLDVADAFHLPVVFLADNPGVLAGTAAERSGVLRHAARMFAAQARVRSRSCTSRCARRTASAAR